MVSDAQLGAMVKEALVLAGVYFLFALCLKWLLERFRRS
jgi:hypothetical protein